MFEFRGFRITVRILSVLLFAHIAYYYVTANHTGFDIDYFFTFITGDSHPHVILELMVLVIFTGLTVMSFASVESPDPLGLRGKLK